jgi:predicted class III extradiol MEMO1 family dioxygenase
MKGMGGMGMGGGDATIRTPMGDIKVNSKAGAASNAPAEITINTPQGNATITTTPGAASAPDTASIVIKTPEGEVKIDAQKMEALAKQMEEMAKKMEQNKK